MSHRQIDFQRSLLHYAYRFPKKASGKATSQTGRHTFGVDQILRFVGLIKDLRSIHITAWKTAIQ